MLNIKKANYIVKCAFPALDEGCHEKWTSNAVLNTLKNIHTDKFYNKLYNFLVPEGMRLKKGDYVLSYSVENRLHLLKVIDTVKDNLKNVNEINKAKNFIIGKVDISVITNHISLAERATYLKMKIDDFKRTFEERKMLEIMAQSDPEAAKIINEYKDLVQFLPK